MPTKDKEKIRMYNLKFRETHPDTKNIRNRNEPPETKKKWNIKSRYSMSIEQVDAMLDSQGGRCAICEVELGKYVIDHNHNSGKVRGLLCHKCNIKLGGWDDEGFVSKALKYLGITL